MSLFNSARADAAFDRFLEPPVGHEIDDCHRCHEEGSHDNPLEHYKACDRCDERLKDRAEHTAIEFKFTIEDVELASQWAHDHKYRYESMEHLLLDAMRSNVIHTDHWKAI